MVHIIFVPHHIENREYKENNIGDQSRQTKGKPHVLINLSILDIYEWQYNEGIHTPVEENPVRLEWNEPI